jgi:hypothetical protein
MRTARFRCDTGEMGTIDVYRMRGGPCYSMRRDEGLQVHWNPGMLLECPQNVIRMLSECYQNLINARMLTSYIFLDS